MAGTHLRRGALWERAGETGWDSQVEEVELRAQGNVCVRKGCVETMEAQPGNQGKCLCFCTQPPAQVTQTGFPRWPHMPLPLCLDGVIREVCTDVPGGRGDPAPWLPGELAQVSPGSGLGSPVTLGPGSSFCSAPSWSALPPLRLTGASRGQSDSFSFQVKEVNRGEQALGPGGP